MASPVTLRLDQQTRRRIERIARRRGVSASQIIREAIRAHVDRQEQGSPYEQIADLVGLVHGGDARRSVNTGRRFRQMLARRRNPR